MHRPLGKIISRLLPFALLALGAGVTAQAPRVYHLQGDYPFTHDPSIAKDGATYYVFATGKAPGGGQFAVRCSEDLEHWRMCGHVFDAIPQWIHERSPGTTDLWAPDISLEHGEYRLYYAYSLFGKNTSGIALATNKTLDFKSPDYKWVDHGLVLESKAEDDFNAIDPNYIEDAHHHAWLSFGSFWGGIKMRALDAVTGMLSKSDSKLYSLATRLRPEHPAPQKFDPEHPTLPPRLAGDRGAIHRLAPRLLLSVCLVRPVLPRHQEQLPDHGGALEVRHRTILGQGGNPAASGRRNSSTRAQSALARTRGRVDSASG